MMRPLPFRRLSTEEYLAAEESSEIQHEYIGGVPYATTEPGDRHGLIASNLAAYLRPLLRGTSYQPFIGDLKLRLPIAAFDSDEALTNLSSVI